MYILEICLFVVGALLLLLGYRKSNRNTLLMAAVLLFLTGTVGDFTSGFSDGLSRSHAATQDSQAASG